MKNQDQDKLQNFSITKTDSTLKIEWSNREIAKSTYLTIFLAVFWIVWTPTTFVVTWLLLFGDGPKLFFFIWLLFGYSGVFCVPLWWSMRWAKETVEFDRGSYRHGLVGYPKWLQRDWKIEELTSIHYGACDDEGSPPTLNVFKGKTHDIIAWWAKPDIAYQLFLVIKEFLEANGFEVPVTDGRETKHREFKENEE